VNTDPLSLDDFVYSLETTIVDNVLNVVLEGPYNGHNENQKISHTVLDIARCPPQGAHGMYEVSSPLKISIEPGLTPIT
jgi:hypothetical protein